MLFAPLISIITPVFNGQAVLAETIESVLNANIEVGFEYLVIDDGSTDDTAKIMKKYAGNIICYSQTNMGESATVNRGLELAKGKYILIISADDPLLSGKLIEQATSILENNPKIVAVYPDWQIIGDMGEFIEEKHLPNFSDEVLIAQVNTLLGPGSIFRKADAVSIGGRNPKWKFVGDYDFWLRLSRRGEVVHIPHVLAQWRSHPKSTSISQRTIHMARERIQVIEDFLSSNNIDSNVARRAKANSYILASRLVYFDSDIPAKKYLFKAFREARGWPSQAQIHVVAYILLLPVSKYISRIVSKIVRLLNPNDSK